MLLLSIPLSHVVLAPPLAEMPEPLLPILAGSEEKARLPMGGEKGCSGAFLEYWTFA